MSSLSFAPDVTAAGTSASAKKNAFSDLSSEQFVKIMFAELSRQDPLQPNDSNALLEQMANLRSIQADLELQNKLDSLVSQNQLASAGNLIGRAVIGLTEQNERVPGIVGSVSQTQEGIYLNLTNGYRVPFNRVDEIFVPPPAPVPSDPDVEGGE